MIRAAVAILATLALAASGAAVVAFKQRQMALDRLAIANSRQLAATAELRSQSDLQTAMLLSAAAFKVSGTAEARANLLRQLQRSQHVERFLAGPGRAVTDLALSPDGGTVVSSGGQRSHLFLRDLAHPDNLPRTLRGSRTPYSAIFSPDGKALAVAEIDRVVVWDLASGTKRATFGGGMEAGTPAFSPDGRTLALPGFDETTISYKCTLWDTATHKKLATLVYDASGTTCLFSPDGRTLAMGISLWDVGTRTLLGNLAGGHTRGVFDMAFSPDGRMIATGGHDAKLILWDVAKRTPLATWQRDGDVHAVAFSPDGRLLAAGDNSASISLWSVAKRTQLDSLTGGHTSAVLDIAFSPDGRTLLSSGKDGRIIVWNITPQNPLILAMAPGAKKSYYGSPAFSPDGRILAIPTVAGAILWDIPRRARLTETPVAGGHPVFSPDGRILVTIAGTNVLLWDVPRGAKVATLTGVAPSDPESTGAVFSPDGRTLATAANRAVILWDVATRHRLATLTPRQYTDYSVHGLAFSPDGRVLATGGYGYQKIILWDIATKTQASAFSSASGEPVYQLSFSPKGDVLAWNALESANTAIGGDFSVVLWDLAANARRATFTVHTTLGTAVAFSPDGRMLASDNGGVSLWSIAQGERMVTLAVPQQSAPAHLRGPVFSADGRLLATTGSDKVVIWDVDTGSWVRRLCAKAGRDLTHAEWASVLTSQPYQPVCRR
ncbi:hypothetical protein AQI88_38860 [Streptomyces cellostaticus]|uniref:Uncharacterized protein n=1 Tax=Streptomyces cellostaticus TaxID=67285 RepID=A0A101NBR9_9ACTN|nr:hypothetical protein AQI88_38860 [Streptomyces cellostaticus]